MPPLDVQQEPIRSQLAVDTIKPLHPSPAISLLGTERMSVRERMWWGHRFGIDTPYWVTPLGWGEDAPVYAFDPPGDIVFEIPTPTQE